MDSDGSLARDGFAILERVVEPEELPALRLEADALIGQRAGARNVLRRAPRMRDLAMAGVLLDLAREVLGSAARPVKATLFDKGPAANWKVPWHQDVAIAVACRLEVPGFGPWSVKDGVPHVEPPAEFLEGLLAVRLHLDPTPVGNGALRVVPGSHSAGKLSVEGIRSARERGPEIDCPVAAGGVMLMRPLLLHASSPAVEPTHRRVLHLEYAAAPLPAGLAWASADPGADERRS